MKPTSLHTAFLLCLAAILFYPPALAAPQTHTVRVSNFQFDPPSLTIRRGDTVVFENQQGSHTVTGTGADPFCGTGPIPASCEVTFETVGTFPYRCVFHSSEGPPAQGMVGTIIVEEAPPVDKANVTPFAPPGWSDKIVVSAVEGTIVDDPQLFEDQELFVDWSVVNLSLTTGIDVPFQTHLFVDGLALFFWTHEPLPPDTFHRVFDKSIGTLPAGEHTLRIWTDTTNLVDESNEDDNQHDKTITILPRGNRTHTVRFQNFEFDPAALTIQAGDTVIFENLGGAHTVTGEGADPFCGTGPVATSCSITFSTPGVYPYRCLFHSSPGTPSQGMVGVITVQGDGPSTILEFSVAVEGPYSLEATADVNADAGIIRLPLPPSSRFYRLAGTAASLITGIRVTGDELELTFQPAAP